MLRGIVGVVKRMRGNFFDRVVDRRVHAVELSVQLLNAVGVVRQVVLTQSHELQCHRPLESLTFDAVTWKSIENVEAQKSEGTKIILPAVNT